jgi:hypothetical protein
VSELKLESLPFNVGDRVKIVDDECPANGRTAIITRYDPFGLTDGLPSSITRQVPYCLTVDEDVLIPDGEYVLVIRQFRLHERSLRPLKEPSK